MLELLTDFICSIIVTLIGFYIIKIITNKNINMLNRKNIILLLILIVIPFVIHKTEYSSTYTLITYLLSIIIYQKIFNQNIIQSVISSSMMMISTFFIDIIDAMLFMPFISVEQLRGIWYIKIIANSTFAVICIFIFNIKKVKITSNKIYTSLSLSKFFNTILFFTLTILTFSVIAYNITSEFGWNKNVIFSVFIAIIFLILLSIFLKEKNNNDVLTAQYDNLFNYVQTFEDWIEKEQLNRHEYKNQLAILRCMTKDKKVISKIDEILEDSINVEGEVANELKALPKGGLKGLMYYKSSIAQKKKVKLTVDVCLESHSLLENLSEKDMKDICKLIGIYFDNAIEAAIETKKKVVCIEIYELKEHVNFVISNTFKQHKKMDKRNEKGVSSKGEGHGNGLYFASKLISKNDWLTQKQEIIDKYYIQTLMIKKPDTK